MASYSEEDLRAAVAASFSHAQVLRLLGLGPTGGNTASLKQWLVRWAIPTDHFDPRAHRSPSRTAKPLEAILVEGSSYARSNLKARLYKEGLKTPVCELCGLGEEWRGRPLSLILDHVNGIRDDNRLDNLRIVCPNCAGTLDTHCGRKNRIEPPERACLRCNTTFRARYPQQRFCSRECGIRAPRPNRGVPNHESRRTERPSYDELVRELARTSYSAVGRKHGVSDNAVRKWVRQYERQRASAPPAEPADLAAERSPPG